MKRSDVHNVSYARNIIICPSNDMNITAFQLISQSADLSSNQIIKLV